MKLGVRLASLAGLNCGCSVRSGRAGGRCRRLLPGPHPQPDRRVQCRRRCRRLCADHRPPSRPAHSGQPCRGGGEEHAGRRQRAGGKTTSSTSRPRTARKSGCFAGNIVVDRVIGGRGLPSTMLEGSIGSARPPPKSIFASRSTASVFKTIDDTFKTEMVTGTAGTSTYDFPVVLNNVLGTKLKLVKGYAGSAALRLAMERREIDGFCGRHLGFDAHRRARRRQGQHPAADRAQAKSRSRRRPVRHGLRQARGGSPGPAPGFSAGSTWSGRSRRRPERRPIGSRRCGLAFDADHAGPGVAGRRRASRARHRADGRQARSARFIEEVYQTPPAVAAKAAQLLGRAPQ